MELRRKIQMLLAAPDYRPLRRAELARRLGLNAAERREFRRVLEQMLQAGEVVRVRQDRFVLPAEADLVVGRVQFHPKGYAFVIPEPPSETEECGEPSVPALTRDIFVSEEDTATALPDDKVVVRLFRDRRQRRRQPDLPAGRIIRVLERAHPTVVGTLQQTRHFQYVVPDDPRFIRDIYVQPHPEARVGHKVVVRLADWVNRHVNPEGTIVEVLGPAEAPGVDVLSIIRKYHLPQDFSPQARAEAERLPESVSITGRRDFRDEFIITIDPDDAKDFDDAVQVHELPGGGWRLGVHIADVSHYVKIGGALDREAQARGNSVYLVDRVLPMLPEKLSNNLCSLRPREDRLTMSVLIDFDRHLRVRRTEFVQGVIRSRHRLTYRQAFALLSESPPRHAGTDEKSRLAIELHRMWGLARRLREQRIEQGALMLEFPEVKVQLDAQGRPVAIEKLEYDISHQLIEEFMLAANEAVAKRIARAEVPTIYRIHEEPDVEKLEDFRAYAQSFGFKLGDVTHRHELQKLLEHVHGRPEQYAINLALLRSLKRALYSVRCAGHYGLAKKYYTHFTSPIRRYADLVVHRILRAVLGLDNEMPGYSLQQLARIARHISETERIADEAEEESVELKKIEFFQRQLETGRLTTMDAVVCGVRNFGFFVELPDTLVQGLVHVSTLEDDFY
ncbi:MAG: ribonuclease R, partial [Verrucomicrobiae bacterium]|nr:ribonuclease R [Verrucomicrobiae bacterium]